MRSHHQNIHPNSNDALPEGGLLRILIVDDDIVDFEAIQRALRNMRLYRVETEWAKNTEVARYKLRKSEYDVVFVDHHLGLDTGSTLIREIGGREARHVIILITARPSSHVQKIAMNAGALHFMSKDEIGPLTLEAVLRYSLYTHELEQRLHAQLIGHMQVQHEQRQELTQMARECDARGERLMRAASIIEQAAHGRADTRSLMLEAENVRSTGRELKQKAACTFDYLNSHRGIAAANGDTQPDDAALRPPEAASAPQDRSGTRAEKG